MSSSNLPSSSLLKHFEALEDPRTPYLVEHRLLDIVALTICAVVCGAEGWEDIEAYGRSKVEWLKTFLELPHGIPSHDTVSRLFARLEPTKLQECFVSWVKAIAQLSEGEVIAIDGKSVRHSYDKGKGLFLAFGEAGKQGGHYRSPLSVIYRCNFFSLYCLVPVCSVWIGMTWKAVTA